jgi:hypothetical protein
MAVRTRDTSEDNIRIDLTGTGSDCKDWIQLAQGKVQ